MNLTPVDQLALARLLAAGAKGETPEALTKSLKPLLDHRWTGPGLADRLDRTLDKLERAGAIGRALDKKGKPTKKLTLTEDGRRIALDALGLTELPSKSTWANLQTRSLAALALGRSGRPVGDLKAEILRSHYRLDLGEKPTARHASDALAARLLGLEPGQKFDLDTVLRKLLRDAGIEIPAAPKLNPTILAEALLRRELADPGAKTPLVDRIAARIVKPRKNSASEFNAALLRSWVDRSETADEASPHPSTPPEPSDSIDLKDFSRRVVDAALESPGGWFGDAKVFISHVWRALVDDPAFRGWDVASFKRHLVEAHRSRLLVLGRADLVEAMDPVDVRESSTEDGNTTYHFVRTEEPGR